jgi:hypothetical protein
MALVPPWFLVTLCHAMETLGKHFRTLTKPAFERHGFAHAELLASWATVVGTEMAALCRPDKLKWPRAQVSASQTSTRKEGGTLVVRAEPGRSLDVHYAAPRLIDRINRYFGYQAVTALKVVRSTDVTVLKSVAPLATSAPAPISIDGIGDDDLRTALMRLGQNVQATTGNPQPK